MDTHFVVVLTVGLGNTLDFILLFDSVRVRGSTSCIDELLSQTLGHGLQVSERGLSCASGQQVEGIVDTTERRHIDGLSTDDTGTSDTSGILTRTGVDDGINNNLDGVLVRQQMDDLQCVLDNSASHNLLTRVATLLHQAARKALNDGARCLTESLLLVSASCVRKVSGMVSLACNVILEKSQRN